MGEGWECVDEWNVVRECMGVYGSVVVLGVSLERSGYGMMDMRVREL